MELEPGDVIREERSNLRRLEGIVARNPNGKLAKRASALVLDYKRFDDFVEGCGGKDGAVFYLCAQVAGGVPLSVVCREHVLQSGLVGALLSERPEWYARYERAQRWLAEEYVAQVVPLADGASVEELPKVKWQGEARLKVAGLLNREKFGGGAAQLGAGLENLGAVLQRISERKQKVLTDATVVSEQ